ncbi:MAG: carbohydrate ABC transporter permease [Chloroflexi bacterium]|nr:carbohydrate ABC transporter permease [Chloroflexota bacterium]
MSVAATAAPGGTTRGWRLKPGQLRRLVTYVILSVVCLIWIYPFLWMMSASVKSNNEIFAGLGLIPSEWHWQNFAYAWEEADIGGYFMNTVAVSFGGVLIVLVTTSMMGYVLGRYSFPGKRLVIGLLGLLVFLPQGYTIIPIFDLINKLHLSGSLLGIILAESGSAHIIMILLFAGYFRQLPKELEESALVDGAGFLRIFLRIFLPLSKPVVATTIILQFIASWNDFLIPLVLTLSQPSLRTLAVGVYSFQGENLTDWSSMAAASTISIMPVAIVFLLLQRYFIEGVAGAVKQ